MSRSDSGRAVKQKSNQNHFGVTCPRVPKNIFDLVQSIASLILIGSLDLQIIWTGIKSLNSTDQSIDFVELLAPTPI